jgi:hypothetical protein
MNRRKGPREHVSRYVRLAEYLLACAAWASLDCVARCLYVEMARRYRGPDSNNGRIPFAVREAAKLLGVSSGTAQRAFKALEDRGFVVVAKRSGFNMQGRASAEWLLTEYPDDREPRSIPLKTFMRWSPNLEMGSTSDTISPSTDTYA